MWTLFYRDIVISFTIKLEELFISRSFPDFPSAVRSRGASEKYGRPYRRSTPVWGKSRRRDALKDSEDERTLPEITEVSLIGPFTPPQRDDGKGLFPIFAVTLHPMCTTNVWHPINIKLFTYKNVHILYTLTIEHSNLLFHICIDKSGKSLCRKQRRSCVQVSAILFDGHLEFGQFWRLGMIQFFDLVWLSNERTSFCFSFLKVEKDFLSAHRGKTASSFKNGDVLEIVIGPSLDTIYVCTQDIYKGSFLFIVKRIKNRRLVWIFTLLKISDLASSLRSEYSDKWIRFYLLIWNYS